MRFAFSHFVDDLPELSVELFLTNEYPSPCKDITLRNSDVTNTDSEGMYLCVCVCVIVCISQSNTVPDEVAHPWSSYDKDYRFQECDSEYDDEGQECDNGGQQVYDDEEQAYDDECDDEGQAYENEGQECDLHLDRGHDEIGDDDEMESESSMLPKTTREYNE